MKITVAEKYLWLPVDLSAEAVRLDVYADGVQVQEIRICLGTETVDFYGVWKVQEYLGKELELVCTDAERLERCPVRQEPVRPENPYPYRPKLHYTPSWGWINDPNGLVYYNGVYHLFYQYNPYSTEWENMSWGHAVSRNLFDWEEQDVAVLPDAYGPAYSGCAFVDRRNASGYGADSLLFFYTAAGGRNDWSAKEGCRFTQRRMWTEDDGRTLKKEEQPVIPWEADENRDPKVFWHEETQAYVMVLYLEENLFQILRSQDLKHWEETQRLQVPGMWECPLLLEVPVEGTQERKWIFWSADGYYQVGTFDGYRFEAESERQMAYLSRRAYAAQNFANVEDRVLLMPWLRLDSTSGYYHGAIGIPQELTLKQTGEGLALSFRMAREMEALRGAWEVLPEDRKQALAGEARELQLAWAPGTKGTAELFIGETGILVDFDCGELRIDTKRPHPTDQEQKGSFDPEEGFDLTVVIDQEVLDVLGAGGRLCGSFETEENVLGASVTFRSQQRPERAQWCVLHGIEND